MRKAVLSLLLLAWLPLCAQEAPAPAAQTARYKVEIEGAGSLRNLLDQHLDISRRAQDKEDVSADEVQRLAAITPEQIRELLATEGYFAPTIRYELDQNGAPWIARFTVQPGPQTLVESVELNFTGEVTRNAQRVQRLQRLWPLDAGMKFTQGAWSDAKNAVLKNLLNQQFPAAAIVNSEARVDPRTSRAALAVEIDSGPAFTFGELEIHGLSRYSRQMIDDANPIRPGEPYSQEKLNEFQSRLQETGYFRSAFATIAVDPAAPHHVPVQVDLSENERKKLGLGIGYSTDTGPHIQARWLDRNFLERQWRLESEARIDGETYLLGSDLYFRPLDMGWTPSIGARVERTDNNGAIDDKLRTYYHLTSPNRVDEKVVGVSLMTDRQRIGDDIINHRSALVGTFVYTRRRLDHPLTPRRGYLASIEFDAGPKGLVNEANIARVFARGVWIVPLMPRWRTVLRGQVGQVFGGGHDVVPDDLLFLTGGDISVRGYSYNSLGVHEDGAIIGGTVTAVASAELVYQLKPDWGVAVFTDMGNASDSWRNFSFKAGSGVGARWRSPIGPVNIDLAYGHATSEVRLHFSIGYGF